MGIRGLMTYMKQNPAYHELYELHGGYLVIDGHSLACQIYISSRCNCSFGGDYDVYSRAVAEFFNDIIKCAVVPLIIMDGGKEEKKMKTALQRMTEKLKSAACYNPASQAQTTFTPLGLMWVFETVLKQKGLKTFRCLHEADAAVAGVAKVLRCPVLSYDSDFYIFGVAFIPISTLMPYPVKTSQGRYAKRCKLFRPENFFRHFPGLDESVLPLASILLGNDYVQSKTFKNFFQCLRLSRQNSRLYNQNQARIHTVLRWLRNYNLEDAVAAVLSKLPRKRRRGVLYVIENIVKYYSDLPCEPLASLGFEEQYGAEMRRRRSNQRTFEFRGNVDTLESRQLWRDDIRSDDSSPDTDSEEELFKVVAKDEEIKEPTEVDFPPWFLERYIRGEFPPCFVNLMRMRAYTIPIQIEDHKYPSASDMSLGILRVIEGLLIAGRQVADLTLFTRDGAQLVKRRLGESVRGTCSTTFPALCHLRDMELETRKRIIDDTLEVTGKEELLEEIPPQWRLYIATILYWMTRSDEPPRDSCHLHALLFTMLFGVIDEKIGYHRSLPSLRKLQAGASSPVASEQVKSSRLEGSSSAPGQSIIEALDAVTKDDCIRAVPFFVSIGTMDPQLVECPRKYNVTIVHVFSQFQACLNTATHLNALLGCPYDEPILAELYNGTMLYNLYGKFAKRSDVEAYVSVTLEKAPSLLNVVKLLIDRVKRALEKMVVAIGTCEHGGSKKRRRNRKKKKVHVEDDAEDFVTEADIEESDICSVFVDPQNPYSALAVSA